MARFGFLRGDTGAVSHDGRAGSDDLAQQRDAAASVRIRRGRFPRMARTAVYT